jgi:hypothetical protein
MEVCAILPYATGRLCEGGMRTKEGRNYCVGVVAHTSVSADESLRRSRPSPQDIFIVDRRKLRETVAVGGSR